MKKKLFYFIPLLALVPIVAWSAYNDVTIDQEGITINLPSNGANYTMTRSTRVESFSVNSDNIEFEMKDNSIVELQSANRHNFTVSTCEVLSRDCSTTLSAVIVQCRSSVTLKITPSGSCSTATSGGASSGGGGSGTTGPGASPSTPTAPSAPKPTTVTITINRPVQIALTSASHSVTVSSASASKVTITIKSNPITLTLNTDESKEVDTNGDGANDLKVTYHGLDETGRPRLSFLEIVAVKAPEKTPATTTPPAPAKPACALTELKAYKYPASPAVYYLTAQCTKRPFSRPQVFFTYFDSWNDVSLTTKEKLDSVGDDTLGFLPWGPKFDPQYGALVKIVTDPKVYLLLSDEKYWITSETVFTTLGYKWNWIEDIDTRLLDKYKVGAEINYTHRHPNFTLVKYADSPKVYRLEPDPNDSSKQVRRHIKNEKAFNELRYRWDRIVTVPKEETYTEGPQLATLKSS